MHAYDQYTTEDEHNTQVFSLTLEANQSPIKNRDIVSVSLLSGHGLNHTITSPIFSEPDGETLIYTYTITPTTSLITFDTTNLAYFNVSDTSDNTDVDSYQIIITASDGHENSTSPSSGTTAAIEDVTVTILLNSPPTVNQTFDSTVTINAERPFTYTHTEYGFEEPDGETLILDGTFSPLAPFITYDSVSRTFTSSPVNSNAGTNVFTLTASDGISHTANATQTVIFIIYPEFRLPLKP